MEQVGTTERAQLERPKQLAEVIQPQRHDHHAGKTPLAIDIAAADRQQVAIGAGFLPGAPDDQAGRGCAAVDGNGLQACSGHHCMRHVQLRDDAALGVEHRHPGNHRHLQRMVKQHARTHFRRKRQHLCVAHVAGQAAE